MPEFLDNSGIRHYLNPLILVSFGGAEGVYSNGGRRGGCMEGWQKGCVLVGMAEEVTGRGDKREVIEDVVKERLLRIREGEDGIGYF